MARTLTGIVLEIEVETPSDYISPRQLESGMTKENIMVRRWCDAASELEKLIARRMDDLKVSDRTYKYTCSFCGSHWTEESNEYNGGCCDEDEKTNPTPEQEARHGN